MTTQTPASIQQPPSQPPVPSSPGRHLVRSAVLVASGAMLLLVGGLSAASLASQRQETESFTAAGVREIVVEVESGHVTLLPGTGPDVEVTTTRHWSFTDASAEHRIEDGVLTVTAECPWFGFGCRVSEELTVPAGVAVRVQTAAGSIDALDVDVASFQAETAAGNVDASFTTAPSDISIATSAGNVHVLVPADTYQVDADASAGNVDVGVSQSAGAQRSIRVETSAGNIDIDAR